MHPQPIRPGDVVTWIMTESAGPFLPRTKTTRTVTVAEVNGDSAVVLWGLRDGEPVRHTAKSLTQKFAASRWMA